MRNLLISMVFLVVFSATSNRLISQDADIIFIGDHIITMDALKVSAVAVQGDRIIARGSVNTVSEYRGDRTRVIELGEHALLPGFIDAHGHFASVANRLELLDLSPPPVGKVEDIEDIILAIRDWIARNAIPRGELIYAVGYDDSLLEERRHPNKADLDKASSIHPIVIRHVSGHLSSANSLALTMASIGADTPDPSGGHIQRIPGSTEPNGVMEETAMRLLPNQTSQADEEKRDQLRKKAFDLYASYGITTIQDIIGYSGFENLKKQATKDPFPLDLVTYIWGNSLEDEQLETVITERDYSGGLRNGGVKLMLDGSPQGRTAWLSQPYTERPPNTGPDYVAYPAYDPETYKKRIAGLLERKVQTLVHANGDQAIELMIEGVDQAFKGNEVTDHRSVIIHAQLMRRDQLDRVKQLGLIPSYFAAHPFFWGDWHRLSFGEDRASFISPVRATLDLSIPYTIHNDAPVVPPDMMRLISIAVNRKTRSGHVLGPDQRATVIEALYAVTQGAAYQYFEEDEKGSITPGKRADLIILERNPLEVDPETLEQIQVIETFSRGESVFRR